jgi:hypothetical protein
MSWLDDQPAEKVEAALQSLREQAPGYIANEGTGDERFALWLRLVDKRMARVTGLGHRDIGDWHWRDAFEDGVSPSEAAREALAADDTFGGLFA